jgi:hypothetical protein
MSFRPLLLGASAAIVLATGFAFAGPALALDTDGPMELAQAAPPPPPAPGAPGAPGADRMMRGERNVSPRAVCLDMTARRIGDRAYIKARLELKPEQMAAWNAFEKAADEASSKSMARCATLPTEMKERPDYIQRLTMEEEAMKARVATIEAVKPSLTALYNILTADQKAVFNRPRAVMAGMGGHHRR